MNFAVTCVVVLATCTDLARSTCSMSDQICEFWLEIENKLTMMADKDAVYPANGKLYKYDVTNTSAAVPIDPIHVITADGWEKSRLVIVVNKTMPGPPIEVFEGQTVIVHVKNKLMSEGLSVHWHGLQQRQTPWMDGVAYVTQCPILPGQTFTYRFKADHVGSFWYHSHLGTQLSMGLIGAFIVRKKEEPPMKEYIMMLQDWNHDMDANLLHHKMLYGNYENRTKLSGTKSLEGGMFSMFVFQSGLINGRGRYYNPNGVHNQAPLTVFNVTQGNSYRFRVVGAGNLYPYRVSVDQHPMTVVSTDGNEFEAVPVESFIINPGERYDFVITANQSVDNYWIRAETLEVNVQNHVAEAILRYHGAPVAEPNTVRKRCSQDDRCLVLNCPYTYYPAEDYTDCKPLSEVNALHDIDNDIRASSEDVEEIFLNFAFPGTTWTPGSVNGRHFKMPPVSALTQPTQINTQCDPQDCGEDKLCECTHTIDLHCQMLTSSARQRQMLPSLTTHSTQHRPQYRYSKMQHNKVYQMVFLDLGTGKGWAHPIHLHGHDFYIVKMGYPIYNQTTGKLMGDNPDIDCGKNKQSYCNAARWANSSWGGNNVPELKLDRPIMKDTVIVPTGGYVVVRIRADNPGLWIMHCHIELHNTDGMAVLFNESFSKHPQPPPGFPTCGDFTLDKTSDSEIQDLKPTIIGVSILLGVAILFIVILLICLVNIWRQKKALQNPDGERSSLTMT